MKKKIICIECPAGCGLVVEIENCRVTGVSGNTCPRGETYAVQEIENPCRILTSTVLAAGLPLTMVPVRTDKPIPKAKIREALQEIRRIRVRTHTSSGEVIKRDFVSPGVNLITTRDTSGEPLPGT
jgi:CxxC motif-containing protein